MWSIPWLQSPASDSYPLNKSSRVENALTEPPIAGFVELHFVLFAFLYTKPKEVFECSQLCVTLECR